VSEKVSPTQRTLTKVNHKVTQKTELIHDLIKYPDYPQPPNRGTPATVQFTRMTLISSSCLSHLLEAGYSDTRYLSFVRARAGKRPIAPRDDQLFLSSGWSPSTCCERLWLARRPGSSWCEGTRAARFPCDRTLLSPPPGRSLTASQPLRTTLL
jgi:hypothetical protein